MSTECPFLPLPYDKDLFLPFFSSGIILISMPFCFLCICFLPPCTQRLLGMDFLCQKFLRLWKALHTPVQCSEKPHYTQGTARNQIQLQAPLPVATAELHPDSTSFLTSTWRAHTEPHRCALTPEPFWRVLRMDPNNTLSDSPRPSPRLC